MKCCNKAIAFLCNASRPCSTINVGDDTYTVERVGTIFALDDNVSGLGDNNLLDSNYLILDNTYIQAAQEEDYTKPSYKGLNLQNYNGNRTFGYLAFSEKGIVEEKNGYVSYVNTMEEVEGILPNTLWIRAYIVATNGSIVYSTSVQTVSILETANYLYTKSMATNYVVHDYLYDRILNKYDFRYANSNFIDSYNKVNYGWNNNLFTPEDE